MNIVKTIRYVLLKLILTWDGNRQINGINTKLNTKHTYI